ncbi:MAG: urea ABC transporter permease subunit UrtB [Desulfobacterales bacterium]|nr:urea ABC transporter permease subunit UrtB [Desulfobacterales bacterium]
MPMRSDSYRRHLLLATIAAVLLVLSPYAAGLARSAPGTGFEEGMTLLLEEDFGRKAAGVDMLAESSDPRAESILETMLAGELFYLKENRTLVQARPEGDGFAARAILGDADLGTVAKRKLKKIAINNSLRGQLESALARLRLSNADAGVRAEAVNKMLATVTPESRAQWAGYLQSETDPAVQAALRAALALTVLRDGSAGPAERRAAVAQLAGHLHPTVRNELARLLAGEPEAPIRKAAQRALEGIDARLAWLDFFETFFFGLSLGSVLVLAAIGLAITFGVIGVINMAHGELIMLGAYTAFVLQQLLPDAIGTALVLSIPTAFVVAGLVGMAIERTIIRFLYGRPLETLLATFGVSLILQQAVRSIFSPLNRSVATPAWMSGAIQLNAVLSLTTNRVVILLFSLLVFAGLALLLKKSSIGLQVRAVAQNRAMARAMGVRAARVDALTFGLGSGIAGIAGVALSQLTNVGPNLGQAYIVDSFMVVVFGGVGNLWGTLLGGLTLGVTNKFLEPWTGAVMAKILVLVFIVLFIQKRPQGLFPQKGRAAAG